MNSEWLAMHPMGCRAYEMNGDNFSFVRAENCNRLVMQQGISYT